MVSYGNIKMKIRHILSSIIICIVPFKFTQEFSMEWLQQDTACVISPFLAQKAISSGKF
jgi:hypothetical protein